MKVVLNRCFGGFGLSDEALDWLADHGLPVQSEETYEAGLSLSPRDDGGYWLEHYNEPEGRSHPLLVECVETLGKASWGEHAAFEVVDIPDDVDWYIECNMGNESAHETHEIW